MTGTGLCSGRYDSYEKNHGVWNSSTDCDPVATDAEIFWKEFHTGMEDRLSTMSNCIINPAEYPRRPKSTYYEKFIHDTRGDHFVHHVVRPIKDPPGTTCHGYG
jgi:hypothetical protein